MGIVRQIKNVTGGYTTSQKMVRDVTANDENTPSRSRMHVISDMTYDSHEVVLIMDILDKRLNDRGKYWRHVLKALALLDYLVHYGSDSVILWCRENLYIVKTLREFHHIDDSGRDVGHPIRARARDLTDLISNAERLEEERSSRGRRPRRYRREGGSPDSPSRRNDRPDDVDEELRRALELSKETAAQEEERRRMAGGRSASQEDLSRAMALSQQNEAALMAAQGSHDPFAAQAFAQQQAQQQQAMAQQQALAQQQAMAQQQQANAEAAALAQAQQEYLAAQQQAQAEAQRLYEMQQAHQQQFGQQQTSPAPMQPLKTGSNNPFAAFNQQREEQAAAASPRPSLGRRPSMHRQSTFDREHMDRLDQILSLDAPMDTFGNTGLAKMPAQHTQGEFVDSSGRGLTAMLTQRKTGSNNNNPFASQGQQYTGIATTQMHPEHTGYGFGNANGNRSSTNLIDL